jgi:hypothetical protein
MFDRESRLMIVPSIAMLLAPLGTLSVTHPTLIEIVACIITRILPTSISSLEKERLLRRRPHLRDT